MIKRFSMILIIVLLVSLCGCFFNESDLSENSSNENSPTKSDSAESNNLSKNDAISINEITLVDDFECKITEVNWYSPSDFDLGTDFLEREEGFEYIVVVLSEKNTSDSTKNAPYSALLSADDQQCVNVPALSLYKSKYKINFGATLPNATAEAYVIYKIPAGANSFKLQILSNEFGENSDYIMFNRTDIK